MIGRQRQRDSSFRWNDEDGIGPEVVLETAALRDMVRTLAAEIVGR